MFDVASTILQQKISQVEGVGEVRVGGGSPPGVSIDVNPTILNHLGLGLEDVRSALAAANANRPKGQISSSRRSWSITATDQSMTAAAYAPLIDALRNRGAVRG